MNSAAEGFASRLGATLVEGPLQGYHHEAYAVRLDATSQLGRQFPFLKLREPRPGVFWYDLRYFRSEDQLLTFLQRWVPRIPQVAQVVESFSVHSFIEGRTLAAIRRETPDRDIPESYVRQIEELFGRLAAVDVQALERAEMPTYVEPTYGKDSTAFLRRLVEHTISGVYDPLRSTFEEIFNAFGVPEDGLHIFLKNLDPLDERPYQLLHCDLHCDNFVVDGDGLLWTIDWELAQIGDPLYDLATHLHLMAYSESQEVEMVKRWQRALEVVRPGATVGLADDLPKYRDYKCIQSVYTDIIRGATAVRTNRSLAAARVAARSIESSMRRAQGVLGLQDAPSANLVGRVLIEWSQSQPG
ncbi:aminoglycoside phosphotransferase family protein [Streptomyces sp. PA03-6a]|nr:aminoglycoside phosphotransferase family protein [Streptomyces sp. PA03-6a]